MICSMRPRWGEEEGEEGRWPRWRGSAACPGDPAAGEEPPAPRIPVSSPAGRGGTRCGSIREAKKV